MAKARGLAALEKKLLHYTGLAIERFKLIKSDDRILIGLSGGKDSLALVRLLHLLQQHAKISFALKVVVVEQGWPGWQREKLEEWLRQQKYDYHFEPTNIAQIVTDRLQKARHAAQRLREDAVAEIVMETMEGAATNRVTTHVAANSAHSSNIATNMASHVTATATAATATNVAGIAGGTTTTTLSASTTNSVSRVRTPCMLCSRMRRGVLYRLARELNYPKLALGHHRDDLIASLMMSICYNGNISSMPPKLLNERRDVVLIRPLAYCQERDIADYVHELALPVCASGCGVEKMSGARDKMQQFIKLLASDNPKVPSNILHALEDVRLTHLMDRRQHNFAELDRTLEEPDGMKHGPAVDAVDIKVETGIC